MLEVEQQFLITDEQLGQLLKLSPKVTTKILKEVYFDKPDFELLKNDTWLRERNGKLELKYRKPEHRHQQVELYEEYTTEDEIERFLGIDSDLRKTIAESFSPIIVITTERKSFEFQGLHFDIDITDFGYTVCEIEKLTVDEKSMELVRSEILCFGKTFGLSQDRARNKAKEYVKQKYASLATELMQNGIL